MPEPRPSTLDAPALAAAVRDADPSAIAEALARVEDTRPERLDAQRALLRELDARTPDAHTVVGLTGPPGVGKSTLAGALIRHHVAAGRGVGVVAVDPSSRRSGGALLGDRARLRFGRDEPVFVRSLAARDWLGGLAPAARAATAVLRAAYPWVLVETVGVGQSEIDVETVADSVVLVLQPGSGDTLQFMKAGILEIPDVLVVHKWDLGALAQRTKADLDAMLALLPHASPDWTPPVLGVSAQSGHGIAELAAALDAHRRHLDVSGEGLQRRARARQAWALEAFEKRFGSAGLEALGGRKATVAKCAEMPGTALDVFAELASLAQR